MQSIQRYSKYSSFFFLDVKLPQGIRIGIVVHGDYGDDYVIKILDIGTNQTEICTFVQTAERTWYFIFLKKSIHFFSGGDSPECYELVLHKARYFNWDEEAQKILVVIGDSTPHPPLSTNARGIDWKQELQELKKKGVRVYGVDCSGAHDTLEFFQTIASETGFGFIESELTFQGGEYVPMNDINTIAEIFMGLCYSEATER